MNQGNRGNRGNNEASTPGSQFRKIISFLNNSFNKINVQDYHTMIGLQIEGYSKPTMCFIFLYSHPSTKTFHLVH